MTRDWMDAARARWTISLITAVAAAFLAAGGWWLATGGVVLAQEMPATHGSRVEASLSGLSTDSIARAEAILATPLPPRASSVVPAAQDGTSSATTEQVIRPRAVGAQAEFIHTIGMAARSAPGSDQIPPSITIAQAILESNWGRSELAQEGYNYFGVKAHSSAEVANAVVLPTLEYEEGVPVTVEAAFRTYASATESVVDHHRFLLENPRYQFALVRGKNPVAFAGALQRAGYATDPQYAGQLVALMNQYDLYQYDRRA